MPIFRRKVRAEQSPPRTVTRPSAAGPPGRGRETDWRSYDAVADAYAAVAERVSGPPGEELARLLEIPPGARVLDVGAGTGAAIRAVVAAAQGSVLAVGVDPSVAMLSRARGAGPGLFAAAVAFDLPFRDGTFSHMVANLALSHFTKYETALFDMMRVLAPGGRLAVSALARGEDQDEFSTTWRSVAEEFAEREMLQDAQARGVPWEERFSDLDGLKETLHDSGLRDIWLERRQYRVEMTVDDYLLSREITAQGRFLHEMLGQELWERFHQRAAEVFSQRFPARFNDFHDVNLAVGHKS
jgi:ubiquinone/menaquinone biosynthesis C-methylase UbiE